MKRMMEIKQALIEAHKAQDWEAAKVLSQEKQKLKRIRRCQKCGVAVTPPSNYCQMHNPAVLAMKMNKWICP